MARKRRTQTTIPAISKRARKARQKPLLFDKWGEKQTICNTTLQRTRETNLGNESDECTETCTQQWKRGEHLTSVKKPLVLEKKAGN